VGVIKTRFGGKVVLIDTGMLTSRYKGRASALEIRDGAFTAIYVGSRERLHPPLAAATEPPATLAASAPHPVY
jgi:hypothetical protein